MAYTDHDAVSESYLGTKLLESGLISREDLQKALAYQAGFGGKIVSVLTRIGAISEDNLLQWLASEFSLEVVASTELPAKPEPYLDIILRSGIEKGWWIDQEVLGWENAEGAICYASRDPYNESVEEVLFHAFAGLPLYRHLIRNYDFERLLNIVSAEDTREDSLHISKLRELAEEAPVIEFVNNLLSQAFDQRASDVHIEPEEYKLEIRFRIDGVLHKRFDLPIEKFAAIASRIKLISGMDIAERRLPQDGRVGFRISGEDVDLRVSSVPGIHGESIVLRLLPKESRGFNIESLGMSEDHSRMFFRWIRDPHGILLVTGPTGSGKSTTLYSAIEAINDRSKKIITVEDPVEYYLGGITQIQVHAEIGYNFARALRSIMRQDPDVVMIGEIRDRETAEIAVQASLTGHLVVSTLHTNSAISAFTRLIDMGIEPFLVATPVRAVMAQRLLRRLCPACAEPVSEVSEVHQQAEQMAAPFAPDEAPRWRQARGCKACQGAGYRGRGGIFELIEVSPEVQEIILRNGSEHDILQLVREKQHFRTLREDGLLKARRGETSLEEVLRVTSL